MVQRLSAGKSQVNLVVIEDDKTTSTMLQQILTGQGYQVTVFHDGREASDYLQQNSPDLVLTDIHVPNRDGFELVKEIRKKDREISAYTPVIVLTGVYTSRNDKAVTLDDGADDFIAKPFDVIELLARVRSLLRVQELYKRSQFFATHDPLTRCYNRRYLLDFIDREISRYRRYKTPFSYMLFDLDHFKQINDEAGHEIGDQVLLHVGFRLLDFFRSVDCVARLGGDEFAAVLPECSATEAIKVARRLVDFMNDPAQRKGLPVHVMGKISFSVGVACFPDDTAEREELMRLADISMYAAKRAGRNRFAAAAEIAHPRRRLAKTA